LESKIDIVIPLDSCCYTQVVWDYDEPIFIKTSCTIVKHLYICIYAEFKKV
jgi:hypothetical protein